MPHIVALLAGAVFGAGLVVAGMTSPRKILDFLDVLAIPSGGWDPSLLMVFIGALPVMFLAYRLQARSRKPMLAEAYAIPVRRDIDATLVGGAALFGVGWGLAGLCPGPAVTMLAIAGDALGKLAVFLAALMLGVAAAALLRRGGGTAGGR